MINIHRIISALVFVLVIGFVTLAQTKVEIATDAIVDLRSEAPTHLSTWIAAEKSTLGLIKEPAYQSASPQYGKLVIGNSTDKKEIAIVIDESDGKPPRVYVDANNNHDLTDDGSPDWPAAKDGMLFKTVVINGTFLINGKSQEVKMPYGLLRFTDEIRKKAGLFYTSQFGRGGTIKVRDKEYKVLALTSSNQGLYSDRRNVRLIIDLNKDGKFDSSKESKEAFDPGELFFLDGEAYQFLGASEVGDKMTLNTLPLRMPEKWKAEVGDKIADFGFKTLDGKDMKLSDFKGKVVLLDFWATWCGPCFKDLPDVKALYRKFDRSKFEIIGVSLDGAESNTSLDGVKRYVSKNGITWPITFDERWNVLVAVVYHTTGIPYQLIIDKDGVIRMIEDGADSSGEKLRNYEALITKLVAK
jgi:peroxiredoxin